MTLALYVPAASPVHRLPAGAKLLCLAALAVLLFARPTLTVAVTALVGTLAVGLGVARLPVAVLARQARAVLWWLVALFVVHALVTDELTGRLDDVAAGRAHPEPSSRSPTMLSARTTHGSTVAACHR